MPTPMILIEPEDIGTPEKRGQRSVAVVGCGKTGVLQAIMFAEAGFSVTCTDVDESKIGFISKGKGPFLSAEMAGKIRNTAKSGRLRATSDIKDAVSRSDIILITTPSKITTKKRVEYSDVESICKRIGSNLQKGSLVIITSLMGIGVTEGIIKETLENTSGLKIGTDLGLAYGPFLASNTRGWEEAANWQRIVAATDKNSLRATVSVMKTLTNKGVKNAVNVKTAEVAALLGILQLDVKLALANETAILCEKIGVDFVEAQRMAGADPDSVLIPPTIGDDTLSDEAYLLLEDAENLNMKLRVATAARIANEAMVKHVTDTVKDALRNCGKTQKRARVAILGVAQTPNVQSPFKRSAKRIVDTLEARGSKINLYDPYTSKNEIADMPYHFKKTMTEAIERADCVIILTAHDQFKRLNLRRMRLAMRMPAAIIDVEGIVEPSKIEKEGFIYRGLGRGVWTK